jgi:hypothetical protein
MFHNSNSTEVHIAMLQGSPPVIRICSRVGGGDRAIQSSTQYIGLSDILVSTKV